MPRDGNSTLERTSGLERGMFNTRVDLPEKRGLEDELDPCWCSLPRSYPASCAGVGAPKKQAHSDSTNSSGTYEVPRYLSRRRNTLNTSYTLP